MVHSRPNQWLFSEAILAANAASNILGPIRVSNRIFEVIVDFLIVLSYLVNLLSYTVVILAYLTFSAAQIPFHLAYIQALHIKTSQRWSSPSTFAVKYTNSGLQLIQHILGWSTAILSYVAIQFAQSSILIYNLAVFFSYPNIPIRARRALLTACQHALWDEKPSLDAKSNQTHWRHPNGPGCPAEGSRSGSPFNAGLIECSVHGDFIGTDDLAVTMLTGECFGSHQPSATAICTDCLQTYMHIQMFPLENVDEAVKYKFPSTNIKCWGPGCSAILSHDVIQQYSDPNIFSIYDQALFQRSLKADDSVVQCASPGCTTAMWIDPGNDNIKIFTCPTCGSETCRTCLDLYRTHAGRPVCPAVERKQESDRIRQEESASEVTLKNTNKCPMCPLRYEKISGCDRITCGSHAYRNQLLGGCSYSFCHLCKGPWRSDGHTTTCYYNSKR